MGSLILLIIGLLAFSNACHQKREEHQVSLNEQSSLSDTISKFHSSLWTEMSASELGNIFYSPLSLHLLLSQIYFGSPKGSRTNSELASLLHLSTEKSNDDTNYLSNYKQAIGSILQVQQQDQKSSTIRMANRMYSAQGTTLKKNFQDILENYFSSIIVEADFSRSEDSASKMNQFVSDQTNGLIKEVIPPSSLSSDTRLILINAIYFKGTWKYTFNLNDTTIEVFHVDNSRKSNYSAMSGSGIFRAANVTNLESDIIELPYSDGKTSMIVVLPNEQSDIRKVENLLGNYGLDSLIEHVNDMPLMPMKVVFPSYETAFDFSGEKLEDALRALRVETIFDSSLCNLSEITDQKTYINRIIHKAVIKINENGSEAAAVSALLVAKSSGPIVLKEFIVDRPFLMFIVDLSTKLPLFAGRIVDPSETFSLLAPNV